MTNNKCVVEKLYSQINLFFGVVDFLLPPVCIQTNNLYIKGKFLNLKYFYRLI